MRKIDETALDALDFLNEQNIKHQHNEMKSFATLIARALQFIYQSYGKEAAFDLLEILKETLKNFDKDYAAK